VGTATISVTGTTHPVWLGVIFKTKSSLNPFDIRIAYSFSVKVSSLQFFGTKFEVTTKDCLLRNAHEFHWLILHPRAPSQTL
jgi:hypothetical protein